MAETHNSLFKTECIRNPVTRPKGNWKPTIDIKIAATEYLN